MVSILKINAGSGGRLLADYVGLAADTPPSDDDCLNGSTFYEIDTGTKYHFDEENDTWYDESGNARS